MKLEIIHQDQNFLVIDKPAGLVADRSQSTKGVMTVQDELERLCPTAFLDKTTEFGQRSGLVHRLDKDTSGLLLVAKKAPAFIKLKKLFHNRLVKKEYLALVHGRLSPVEGTINLPLSRSRFDRKKFGVFLGGRSAKTDYRREAVFYLNRQSRLVELKEGESVQGELFSFCRVLPLTGRTHQIRIHLKSLGHPIVADQKYGGRKNLKKDLLWCRRQFLHAEKLSFKDPFNHDCRLSFTSLLPVDLKQLFA